MTSKEQAEALVSELRSLYNDDEIAEAVISLLKAMNKPDWKTDYLLDSERKR